MTTSLQTTRNRTSLSVKNQDSCQLEELDISLIRTDGGTQPRAGVNEDVLEEYTKAMTLGVLFPPITVFYDGESYWLADGYHRLEAAKKTGASVIAVDFQQGTRRDAVLYSVGANATHGLRRTNADKRRAVVTLLRDEEWSKWTNRRLAATCGVDEGLVRAIKLELSADYPQIQNETFAKKCGVDVRAVLEAKDQIKSLPQELTTQRSGKTYKVNTAQIGRSSTVTPKDVSDQAETIAIETQEDISTSASTLVPLEFPNEQRDHPFLTDGDEQAEQVSDLEKGDSVQLGRKETDLLKEKIAFMSSSLVISASPQEHETQVIQVQLEEKSFTTSELQANTVASTEENELDESVQYTGSNEGKFNLPQDSVLSTEDLNQICAKFCSYVGDMNDNQLEAALQALASCISLAYFVDCLIDNQIEEVHQALASRLLPDQIAKDLSQAQIEGLWQVIAPRIPAKLVSFFDWSTSELEDFVTKAQCELEQRKQKFLTEDSSTPS